MNSTDTVRTPKTPKCAGDPIRRIASYPLCPELPRAHVRRAGSGGGHACFMQFYALSGVKAVSRCIESISHSRLLEAMAAAMATGLVTVSGNTSSSVSLASSARVRAGNGFVALSRGATFNTSQSRAPKFVVRAAADDDEEDVDVDEIDTKKAFRDGARGKGRGDKASSDGFSEEVLQVSRVTKVVKGGKQMSFRAVVAVGDKKGKVGVGCGKAKEVMQAVEKAVVDGKKNLVTVPIVKSWKTFPHEIIGNAGAASIVLKPAAAGTGVLCGGSVRAVLLLAGYENALGKQLGSRSPLNNCRAAVDGLLSMRTFDEVAKMRGRTKEEMWN
eukprot:jgi/Mesvir1/28297/Mv04818-RA.1